MHRIRHSSIATIAAAKQHILRQRRRGVISLDSARDAWTALESDDDDLEAQAATLLEHQHVFGHDPLRFLRGHLVERDRGLWREELNSFLNAARLAGGGRLYGEIAAH
jgi:hypothetical protein